MAKLLKMLVFLALRSEVRGQIAEVKTKSEVRSQIAEVKPTSKARGQIGLNFFNLTFDF